MATVEDRLVAHRIIHKYDVPQVRSLRRTGSLGIAACRALHAPRCAPHGAEGNATATATAQTVLEMAVDACAEDFTLLVLFLHRVLEGHGDENRNAVCRATWPCDVAVRRGRATWQCDVAVRRGGATWRCDVAPGCTGRMGM